MLYVFQSMAWSRSRETGSENSVFVFILLFFLNHFIHIIIHLVHSYCLSIFLKFIVLQVELFVVFVGQDEVKGEKVIIKVVDKVPEHMLIALPHCGIHINLHVFTFEKQDVYPFVKLSGWHKDCTFFFETTLYILNAFPYHHFQLWCLNLSSTVCT